MLRCKWARPTIYKHINLTSSKIRRCFENSQCDKDRSCNWPNIKVLTPRMSWAYSVERFEFDPCQSLCTSPLSTLPLPYTNFLPTFILFSSPVIPLICLACMDRASCLLYASRHYSWRSNAAPATFRSCTFMGLLTSSLCIAYFWKLYSLLNYAQTWWIYEHLPASFFTL